MTSFLHFFLPLAFSLPSLISITERTIGDLSQRRSTHCHHITLLDCFYQLNTGEELKRKQKMSQPRGRRALAAAPLLALPKNIVHSVWKRAKKSDFTTMFENDQKYLIWIFALKINLLIFLIFELLRQNRVESND